MRDTIKTYEYFKEYLVLNEKRLVRFQNQLKALPAENITGRQCCTAFIASLYRSRICALYSSEADTNTIRKLCPQYIKYLVQAVEPQEGYFDVIDALSLCVLFGIEECLPDLKTVLRQTDVRDKLTDSLLHNLDYGGTQYDGTSTKICGCGNPGRLPHYGNGQGLLCTAPKSL